MAQYGVTYSCGHSGSVTLFGPGKERDRKRAYFKEHGLCSACYRAAKDAEGPSVVLRSLMSADGQRGAEVVVTNSFVWREVLRARGYRYSEDVQVGQINILKGTPAWCKSLWQDADLQGEAAWIAAQKWPVRAQGPIESLIAIPLEANADVARGAGVKMPS